MNGDEQNEVTNDTLGRVDTILIEGARRLVVQSGDSAMLALYGKYGGAFNALVTDFFGPLKVQK